MTESGEAATASRPCPACNEPVLVAPKHVTWCPACEWNVDPSGQADDVSGTLAGNRQMVRPSTALFESLEGQQDLRAGRSWQDGMAMLIAVVVHVVDLGILLGGGALVVVGWPSPFAVVIGVAMIGLAILARPRIGSSSLPDGVLRREDAPVLFGLVDEIAAAIDAPPVDAVCVDAQVNAAMVVRGLRRTRVLDLGLPLWWQLDPQARVALIGHELGHAVNGDAARGVIVQSARDAMFEWHAALHGGRVNAQGSEVGLVAGAGNATGRVLLRPIAWLVKGVIVLHERLLLRSSQRAEYLADLLAARAASSSAVIDLLDALTCSGSVDAALQAWAIRRSSTPAADAVRAMSAELPALERERLRRLARLREHRVGSTHPPTFLRRQMVESRRAMDARVVLDAERAAAVDIELSEFVPEVERLLRAAVGVT